jgi:hypothetical protein
LERLLVGQQQQQNNDSFLISHFLFFFSSSIGALQVMMVTLRVANVSQVLWMTFIVVLNMALHAKGAEWVGEDMVLVCMPELVAALLWFIDHFDDHGGYTKCIIDKVISLKSGVIILSAAVILVSSTFATDSDRSVAVPTMSFRVFVVRVFDLSSYWTQRPIRDIDPLLDRGSPTHLWLEGPYHVRYINRGGRPGHGGPSSTGRHYSH